MVAFQFKKKIPRIPIHFVWAKNLKFNWCMLKNPSYVKPTTLIPQSKRTIS